MATNWVQLLKNYVDTLETIVGTEGGAALADKLTAARAALLDQITAARMAELDAANIPADIDTLLSRVTAAVALASVCTEARLAELDAANLPADIDTIKGYLDTEIAAILAAVDTEVAAIKAVTDNLPDSGALSTLTAYVDELETRLSAARAGYLDNLSAGAVALEATLTAIKGAGWTTETLKAIKDAIGALGAVNQYQERIPDTDFSLVAIDATLTADPPSADAENSVVDIDAIAGSTFVLRSLWVNVTSFGTGTKLTFKLWVPLNGVTTNVDSVDVASLGIQNLADIFGLQEVHADSIHITVQIDAGNTGACAGTYRYAEAS